jgi:hypothetical protein
VWYVDIDEPTRLAPFVQRHITFGKRPAAAHARGRTEAINETPRSLKRLAIEPTL